MAGTPYQTVYDAFLLRLMKMTGLGLMIVLLLNQTGKLF